MNALPRLLTLVLITILVSACGKKYSVRYTGSWNGGDVNEFLSDTKVFNPEGDEIVPKNERGQSPFALLFYLVPGSKSYGSCSASHILPGRVATAAHCIEEYFPSAEDYFVVYFNKSGKMGWAGIEEIEYSGAGDTFDMAILKISSNTASDWHSLDGSPVDYDDQFSGSFLKNRSNPKRHNVSFWVFNPFTHHSAIDEDEPDSHGGVFEEKTAILTRREIEVRDSSGTTQADNHEELMEWSSDEKHTGFVDQLSFPIVKGNSGGLITISGDTRQLVGVVSRFQHHKEDSDKRRIGNDNVDRLWNDVVSTQRGQWNVGDRDWNNDYGGSTGTIDYTLTSHVMVTIFDSLKEFENIFTTSYSIRTP